MTSNGSPAIEVRGLAKRFGEVRAVAGIDFDVREGEVFGFLGPNGAGKTTTINMLTGLARPNAGTMRIAGIDCSKNPKAAQHLMGIVPDESNLWPEPDGFENLAFCGALYGMARREREERARELLGTFGLADASKRKFGGYSKGMKRKLAIVFRIADRYGFQNKAITVVTDERGGRYNLSLRVHLPEAPAIAPTFVHWRVGQERAAKTITIRLKGDSPFKDLRLAGVGGRLARRRSSAPGFKPCPTRPAARAATRSPSRPRTRRRRRARRSIWSSSPKAERSASSASSPACWSRPPRRLRNRPLPRRRLLSPPRSRSKARDSEWAWRGASLRRGFCFALPP
jgi:ABC-type transport system involved in cytochrome c biogenesis ATPase subunit